MYPSNIVILIPSSQIPQQDPSTYATKKLRYRLVHTTTKLVQYHMNH